jgi:hypothetical protein
MHLNAENFGGYIMPEIAKPMPVLIGEEKSVTLKLPPAAEIKLFFSETQACIDIIFEEASVEANATALHEFLKDNADMLG